eukprot:87361_1
MALNELNHALLPTVGHSFLVHETPPIARNFLPFPTTNLTHPLDPFMNDPQSNGTSYPILWRVHGPTPHNWRCFGLDVGRHCYLLIQYIVLLAIYIGDCFHPHTIIIQIAMESNTNDAIPIHLLHALSRLLFWRTGASTMATPNPNQTVCDRAFLCPSV